MDPLFSSNNEQSFQWKDIKTFLIRSQYNELLKLVSKNYFKTQFVVEDLPNATPGYSTGETPGKDPAKYPGFLNINRCLTLTEWGERCQCGEEGEVMLASLQTPAAVRPSALIGLNSLVLELEISLLEAGISLSHPAVVKLMDLIKTGSVTSDKIEEIKAFYGSSSAKKSSSASKVASQATFKEVVNADADKAKKIDDDFNQIIGLLESVASASNANAQTRNNAENQYQLNLRHYRSAQSKFEADPTQANREKLDAAKKEHDASYSILMEHQEAATIYNPHALCEDTKPHYLCLPKFFYQRKIQNYQNINNLGLPVEDGEKISFLKWQTESLTVGSVIWLYYYERMGIFKIQGVLMDDYNYKGKYTISGNRSAGTAYSELMDMICTLHRMGISSNLRDRVCTYRRVLGVDIGNNMGIESERNEGLMENFKKLMDNMLEYYDAKRLAKAIQNSNASKSSVATQTSILDTIRLLKEQFEPFQYGRNQINTFLGIATVHATLCLVNMLRKEIGIPDQYNKPEEFIPAAYDILVAKEQITRNTTNRFIVYDNCASYGYRLLTDIEIANINEFNISDTNSNLTIWLDDVEGIVEGYRSAYASIPEKALEMV